MFITIEGCDGAGKSTQTRELARRMSELGLDVGAVREPGGTPVGEALRGWLKGGGPTAALTELLMFEAARAELVASVIRPALQRGAYVVSDRFADSSLAYQGFGRGLPLDQVRALNDVATGGLAPALTVLLDLDLAAALERQGAANRVGSASADDMGERFEGEDRGFHRRVIDGYRALAAAEPNRWLVIDAARPREDVAGAIWAGVEAVLGRGE